MIGHYFTVAFRNLARNKLYTVINFVGLTVALVCVLLVSIYVRHELSYDRHFEKADRIYRVGTNVPINDGSIFKVVGTALPLGPALENDFSEVEKAARLSPSNGSFRIGKNTHEDFFYWADPQIFELFEATVVSGDLTTALNSPNTFVMTERAALKYFGTKDAVGQTMVLDRDRIVEVTAIIKSWPATSHLASPMFGSMLTAQDILGDAAFENWNNTGNNRTYILMSQDASIDILQSALPDLLARNTNTATAPRGFALDLTALTDVYLAEGRVDDIPPKGSAVFIGVAISVVATLLFVAAFNFIILSLSLAQVK